MRLTRKLAALAALLAFGSLAAQGQVPQNPAPAEVDILAPVESGGAAGAEPDGAVALDRADVEAWLDGFMPYALATGEIAGAVVVVVEGDSTVLQKGYGFADVAAREPVDPETTLFRPGSVSKLFTWTAVMQQVEEGKIDLDADVNEYLDFTIPPYEGQPITMRQIMTHTAGFEEAVRNLISSDPEAVMTMADYTQESLPARVFAPGSTPAYSNYATALAGRIVERTSGMDFDDYIDQRIFAPLGMEYATFRQPLPERLQPLMSKGYATVTGDAEPFEIVIPAPAGSLSASGAAMAEFMKAHLADGGPLLKPETARMMHDYRAPGVGPLNTMALGFYEQWINGNRAIAHAGDTGYFHTNLVLFPDSDLGIYISVNSAGTGGAPQAIRSALVQQFASRYMPNETDYTPIDPETSRQHAQMMAGNYTMSRGSFTNFMSVFSLLSPAEVSVGENGQLLFPALDGLSAGPRDWVEVEPFVWRDRNTGERLAAQVEDGEVVRFSIDTVSPFTVMEPVPFGADPGWLFPAFIFALAVVLLAALAWPVRALVRRHYKAGFALTGRSLTAYRLTRTFCWLVLLALAGWVSVVMAFSADIGSLNGSLDWLLQTLRVLTPVATIGLLALAIWHLWNCFTDGRRWTMKLGAVLLVLAALVLAWITVRFNLYGFGLVF
ncbi:serine hydrolase domain-containing protein [Aurantiacibacter zhengii]|uniref:Class A beta-lactamase-related serine hydrolase n=1 Tax=Aurantiacibacter zhengii TaxID=2307003 RepID=A0A418NQB8_9SPHN|nr:serine hydrolase domain-containing protein [Aurantiacibacter zhengii]RIV84999.1 class A beta-lactamase-related serine hydrolase [Aurantiacibacter zhengii]